MTTRIEHDLLGERQVPADAYWGIHTLRARENFPISGTLIGAFPDLVQSLALVKHAAALANRDLGDLDAAQAEAIVGQGCCDGRRAVIFERGRAGSDLGFPVELFGPECDAGT